ncbi:MAG TPA: toll/interleukin-1 receptor domain-containing protein [Pyrinomonadaceae bacterium]|jgi:hypothetical protein
MADIFISHIREEAGVARALRLCILEEFKNKYPVFISSDKRLLLAGELWLERIREELESAKIVVLLLSTKSLGRPWVNFEAGGAWLTKKALIPACFGELRKKDLPKPYSDIQAIKLPRDSYPLMCAIAKHLRIACPPEPPIRPSHHKKLANYIEKFLTRV